MPFMKLWFLWFLFKRVPLFKTGVCSDLYNTMYWSWQSTFLVQETKLIGGEPLHLCLSGGIPVQIRAPNCWWSVTSFLRWPIVGVYYLFESKVETLIMFMNDNINTLYCPHHSSDFQNISSGEGDKLYSKLILHVRLFHKFTEPSSGRKIILGNLRAALQIEYLTYVFMFL